MGDPVLKAEGISKSYGQNGQGVLVLQNLSCAIAAGEFVALLGPSGSGKSTLLNILGLMDQPDTGKISVAGRLASNLDVTARAMLRNERLGFVFQFDSLLPEFTLLENVLMPCRIAQAHAKATKALEETQQGRAQELLARFGLLAAQQRFPSQVSGGERQRAALCRALVNQPAAVLADEPTGNLDKTNAELVFKDLRDLSENYGVAVLMATHNEESRRFTSRMLRIKGGTLAEEE